MGRAGQYHFYLRRSAVVRMTVRAADSQRFDFGIAMAHFQNPERAVIAVSEDDRGSVWKFIVVGFA